MSKLPGSAERSVPEADAAGFESRWRQRFGEYASVRDDDAGIAGWTPTGLYARVCKFVSLWHGAPSGQFWLDAGCGAGTYTRLLSECGLEVVGVDYSPTTIAKACARDSSGNVYAVADVRRLPFRTKTFHGVVCFGVTQALSRSDVLVNELAAVVTPGGELWIDGLNRNCLLHMAGRAGRFIARRRMHLRYETPAEIMRLMRNAGLVDVKRYWLPVAPSGMPRLQRFFENPFVSGFLDAVSPLGALASHSFIVHGRCPSLQSATKIL